MVKVVKNAFGNFLITCLILATIAAWFYVGKPQIWENPAFPPEIQEASAEEVTKTYAFANDSESWVGNNGADTTDTYQAGAGNPQGCIETSVTGKNKINSSAGWLITGVTWETLGITPGEVIDTVDGKYDWRCSDYTNGQSTSTSGNLVITDAVDSNATTLETGQTFGSTTTWATYNVTGAVSMPAALQASDTSIKIKLLGNLRTSAGTAGVARQMDNVVLIITTTTAAVYSVTVVDGVVAYGIVNTGATNDTTADGEAPAQNDQQHAQNNENNAADFNIRGLGTSDPDLWVLVDTIPTNAEYRHRFATQAANYEWRALASSYQTLKDDISANTSQDFHLEIMISDNTTVTAEQRVDVIVQAVEP